MPLQKPLSAPIVQVVLNTTQVGYNLSTDLQANYGWNGTSFISVILVNNDGNHVGSNGAGTPALTIPNDIPGIVRFYNRGFVSGAGGSAPAGNGGNALVVTHSNVILDNSGGTIRSGGGGGGNGGGCIGGVLEGTGEGSETCVSDGASGGTGGQGQGYQQNNTGGGSGGVFFTPCRMDAGSGGGGGSYGNNGASGGNCVNTNCQCNLTTGSGGGGGSRGIAINGFSNLTVLATGTIVGPTSG